jgi:hypothetical protein
MDSMYAFCETWLAQEVGVQYTPWILNTGDSLAVVSRQSSSIILETIENLFTFEKIVNRIKSCNNGKDIIDKQSYCYITSSNISGLLMIIHPFWINDDTFLELVAKNTSTSFIDMYDFITLNSSANRFEVNEIIDSIKIIKNKNNIDEIDFSELKKDKIINADLSLIDNVTVSLQNGYALEGSNNIIVVNEKTDKEIEMENIVRFKSTILKNIINNIKDIYISKILKEYGSYDDNSYLVSCFVNNEFNINIFEKVKNIANSIKKHIIILDINYESHIKNYLKKNTQEEIKKNILFFFFIELTNGNNSFEYKEHRNNNITCFGVRIERIFVILNKLKNNFLFNDFDMVYRDHITNIIWGLQKENMIFFMIPIYTNSININNSSINDKCLNIIFDEFVNRYLKTYTLKQLFEIDKKLLLSQHTSDKENFVKYIVDNSSKYIENLKKDYEKYKMKYNNSFNEAMESAKMMDRSMELISRFNVEDFKLKEIEKAKQSYDKCLELNKVLSISLEGDHVNINTKNLYAYVSNTDKWYDIGTFLIIIGINTDRYDESNTVKVYNTKHTINGYEQNMNAPHIFSDGHICHGNLGSQLIDSYRNRDLYSLVYQIIIFIESVNTTDAAGKYITNWPEVTKEVALSKEDPLDFHVMYKISEIEKTFNDKFQNSIPVKI